MYSIPPLIQSDEESRAKIILLVLISVIVPLLCREITIRWIQQNNEYRIRTKDEQLVH